VLLAGARQPTASRTTRPLTLGVLVDRLDGDYQDAVVGGVADAAGEAGINLLCLSGGELHAPTRFSERRNAIYELAGSRGIDGLVILAGTIANECGLEDLAAYCDRLRPLPMSSIAAEVPGMTSVVIDGEPALREGIRHLIEDHGYRRIAFLSGPEGNLEARARLRIYREMLASHGLAPPDSGIATGDFRYETGVDAVATLLDARNVDFDAMVVANDQMALGVIDALRARGVRVPRDVAIIGFDDVQEARYTAPPLTTVRQPLRQQGRLAVEALGRRLRGEPVDDVLTLPSELVIRRSCGCYSDARRVYMTSHVAAPPARRGVELTVDDSLRRRRPRILEAMREAVAGSTDGIPGGWEAGLLDALVGELQGGPANAFADRVNSLLEDVMRTGATGSAWQPALSALRRELTPCLVLDPVMRSRAEDLLQEARVLVAESVEHSQAQHRLTIERRARALSDAAETLSAAFDLASMADALRDCLPRLGIASAYVVLDDGSPASPARVAFAHDSAREPDALEAFRDASPLGSIVPDGLLPSDHTYAMAVEPLFFKDDPFGYVMFEMGQTGGLVYETLREQISGVLKVTSLIEELKVRAVELQEAYGALQDNQQRLLSAEKMATLGRVTANIAHEMNTPLAAVRAALLEIDTRAVEYQESVGDDEVTREDHLQIAAEMRASIQLARSAAERAAGFVRGIKTQTRDLAPQEKMRFDPVPVIEESLLLLGHDSRRALGGVRFEAPEELIELLGTPGRLAQIVTNLVTNALDALPETRDGRVTVTLSADDHVARLVVQDTGGGIPHELRDKVFEPMFTTKPLGQGTGLGLSIVRDLVNGHFGGRVDFESEPGQGATFTVTFPLAGGR
jgi:DNA-binding LacI/PurR family transcriptional regulator/signal transduction histidine kinase